MGRRKKAALVRIVSIAERTEGPKHDAVKAILPLKVETS